MFQISSSDSNSFLLSEDRMCVRYLRLTIHVTNYEIKNDSQKIDLWSPWVFPNITYWALKLVRLTENSQSMFFDPIFLSYSALKNMFIFGQLAFETCTTNLHSISMSQAKKVQTKLYSSFIFLINEAVDQ